ncbi:MAG: hypothetical protein CL677_05380 [Bdellovibrionaceae bacterium]|nr:hypothetical protein [Pseudobdellovibrionaceae bacterium]|tara:strand:+ start:118975 stop:120036 length:1062 start_codon:yes stop_codon:yes gene_type:complete
MELESPHSLQSLSSVRFYQKCLNDDILDHICNTPNIKELLITNENCPKAQRINGRNFHKLSPLKKLRTIDFDYNDIDPNHLPQLNEIPNLSHLKILGNDFGRKNFAPLSELEFNIEIADNQWEFADPDELIHFLEQTKSPYINFSMESLESTLDSTNLYEAFLRAHLSKRLRSIKLSGDIPSEVFLNLSSSRLESLFCTGILEDLSEVTLKENHTLRELSCSLESAVDIEKLTEQYRKLNSLAVANLNALESGSISLSGLNVLNIAPDKYSNSMEYLDLTRNTLIEILNQNESLKVILPSKTNFYTNDVQMDQLEALTSLLEPCGNNRCMFYLYGNKYSLDKAIEVEKIMSGF